MGFSGTSGMYGREQFRFCGCGCNPKQEVVHVETLDDLRRITRAIQRDLRD